LEAENRDFAGALEFERQERIEMLNSFRITLTIFLFIWGNLSNIMIDLPPAIAGPSEDAAKSINSTGPSPQTIGMLAKNSSETATKTPGKTEGREEKVWRSQELSMLAVGLGIGDVDNDGQNEIVVADPSAVYVYRLNSSKLDQIAEFSVRPLEIKSIDVARLSNNLPCRIYVSAQNRGSASSLVLEYRNGQLVPVIQEFNYFLRIINYPTVGPILLGQRKGMRRMYEGPIFRINDKGTELTVGDRFGVPLKIPIFGFAVGDFDGKRKPLIAVYDRNDHLRIYKPDGTRLYVSEQYIGGSDIILRWGGPEDQVKLEAQKVEEELDVTFFRPRIMALDVSGKGVCDIVTSMHSSKTRRLLSRSKMLEDGQIVGWGWNGDTVQEKWSTPKVAGMIADFAIDSVPGFSGRRLITLERKKTDWLSFILSKSELRIYDLDSLVREGAEGGRRKTDD
jgi:hypothetical protein